MPRSMTIGPSNPYAPPRAAIDPVPRGLQYDYYEEDGCLVVRNGSVLPGLCVLTGEPAEAALRPRTIRQIPSWTIMVFIFLSPLLGILSMLALQRKFQIALAIGERAVRRRRIGMLLGLAVLTAAVATIVLAARASSTDLILLGMAGTGVGAAMAFSAGQPYRARKSSGDYVYLQLHAEALYQFERYKEQHQPAPAMAPRSTATNSPF